MRKIILSSHFYRCLKEPKTREINRPITQPGRAEPDFLFTSLAQTLPSFARTTCLCKASILFPPRISYPKNELVDLCLFSEPCCFHMWYTVGVQVSTSGAWDFCMDVGLPQWSKVNFQQVWMGVSLTSPGELLWPGSLSLKGWALAISASKRLSLVTFMFENSLLSKAEVLVSCILPGAPDKGMCLCGPLILHLFQ